MHLFFVVFCMNVIQQKKNQLNRSLFLSRQRKFIIFVWRHGGYVAVWNEETAAALVEKTFTEELNTVQFHSFFFLLFTETRWPLISRLNIMHAPWVTPSLPLNSDTRPSNGNEHINGLVLKHISTFALNIHRLVDRAVFKWLSKVIPRLRLLRLVIGLKDSRQFCNQWEAKPKPIAPCTRDQPRDLSRASSELHVIARNCDWFIALPAPVVIGRNNCFGFGFSTFIWKPLYATLMCWRLSKSALRLHSTKSRSPSAKLPYN